MGNIVSFSSYVPAGTEANAAGLRFRRPVPVQIKDEAFVDEAPAKRKNKPEPLKNADDINRITGYLVENKRYRDNLLFVMGINFGLRCGDLLRIKVGHILDSDGSFRAEVRIQEEKTKKVRTCYMNDSIMDAAELYFLSKGNVIDLNDYLFTSQSNNNTEAYYETLSGTESIEVKRNVNAPITVYSVERMLKKTINEELGIKVHAGTHLLRKTFAYHVIMGAPDRTRAVEFLQKIFGHASQSITLAYIGITDDEVRTTCQGLNLGSKGMNICYSAGLSNVV